MDRQEIQKLQAYFRKRFNMPSIEVRPRPQKGDSAEVYIGDEFIGVVFATTRTATFPTISPWPSSTSTSNRRGDGGGGQFAATKPAARASMPLSIAFQSPRKARLKR